MKKFKIFGAAALSLALCAGFASCSKDDDEGPAAGELVTPDTPSQEGWDNYTEDGIMKYVTESSADLEDGEANSYYAFNMKEGICREATFSAVFANDSYADQVARLLNSGVWNEDDEDEDDWYERAGVADTQMRGVAGFVSPAMMAKAVKNVSATRAGNMTLVVPCYRNGRVVYVFLNNFNGRQGEDIKDVMRYWDGESYYVTPDRFIFGEWNPKTGVYTHNNCFGVGLNYKVTVGWDSNDYVNSYVTDVTCPSEGWANMMYEIFKEQEYDYIQMFGRAPEVSVDGRTVTVKAIVDDNVTVSHVEDLLKAYDWTLGHPFVASIFN